MESPHITEKMTESDRIRFLESLLSHYEALVQDMSTELVQYKDDLRRFTVVDIEIESKSQCTKCEAKDLQMQNLAKQIETVNKAKDIQHRLWKSCMEQIENCENQKLSFHTLLKEAQTKDGGSLGRKSMPIPNVEDLFSKWKLLQVYTTGLEGRIEKTVQENKMYRRRLLETKLENEVQLKKLAAEKIREIETTKSTFSQEIEYLKSSIEQSRKGFNEAVHKRLEKEYETWKNQENLTIRELEQKIEATNADREALLIRDTQMSIQLREIAKELLLTRKHLEGTQQEKWRLEVMLCKVSAQIQKQQLKPGTLIPNSVKDYPILLTTEVQTEETQETKQLKENRVQMERLQDEFTKLLDSKAKIEKESEERMYRFTSRLSELEKINVRLEMGIEQQEKEKTKVECELEQMKKKDKLKQIMPNIQDFVNGHDQGDARRSQIPVSIPTHSDVVASILSVKRLEEQRRQIRELTFTDHIRVLEGERQKLMATLDKQKLVAHRWETEYKSLLQSLEMR